MCSLTLELPPLGVTSLESAVAIVTAFMSVLRSVTLFESAADVALAVVLVTDEVTLAAFAPWCAIENEKENEKLLNK